MEIAAKLFTETDAERVHLHVIPLGHQEMTEFMVSHQETQAEEAEDKHQDIAK
jgi:hypothetical protein